MAPRPAEIFMNFNLIPKFYICIVGYLSPIHNLFSVESRLSLHFKARLEIPFESLMEHVEVYCALTNF